MKTTGLSLRGICSVNWYLLSSSAGMRKFMMPMSRSIAPVVPEPAKITE